MAGTSSKTKPVSVRIPNEDLAVLDAYAAQHGVTRAAALLHYLHLGMAEATGASPTATRADLDALKAEISEMRTANAAAQVALLDAVRNQPVQVQQLLTEAQPEQPKGLLARLFSRQNEKH